MLSITGSTTHSYMRIVSCVSDSVQKVPRWNFWKFLVNPEGRVIRFWRTDEPTESIRQEVTAMVREIILKKRVELWWSVLMDNWACMCVMPVFPALWQHSTRLNCYSERGQVKAKMLPQRPPESLEARHRVHIPDCVFVCMSVLWLMTINQDEHSW